MNNFDTELKERTAYVEKIVYDYCPKEEGLQKIIIEAMNYSLKAGGKRLRPMLVLETLRLFGGDEKEAYPFMAAMEMICIEEARRLHTPYMAKIWGFLQGMDFLIWHMK